MAADPSSISTTLASLPISYQAAAAIGVFAGGIVVALRGYAKPAVAATAAPLIDPSQARSLIDAISRLPQLLQDVRQSVDRAAENASRCDQSVAQVERAVRDLHDTLKPR